MTAQNEGGIKAYIATEALAAFRRVRFTAGTSTHVEYADKLDSSNFIGWTLEAAAINDHVAVGLKKSGRTFKATASEVLAAAAALYAADDGKVADTASGNRIATALQAATADGDVIEIVSWDPAAIAPSPANTPNEDATPACVPFIVRATLTAAGAEDEVLSASFPRKAAIIDAWMFARDTNAVNVTLNNAGTAFTGATAKGATDDAEVKFNSIVEYQTIAKGAAVTATFSGAAVVEVVLLCVPLA
jgi:hypothetical protein